MRIWRMPFQSRVSSHSSFSPSSSHIYNFSIGLILHHNFVVFLIVREMARSCDYCSSKLNDVICSSLAASILTTWRRWNTRWLRDDIILMQIVYNGCWGIRDSQGAKMVLSLRWRRGLALFLLFQNAKSQSFPSSTSEDLTQWVDPLIVRHCPSHLSWFFTLIEGNGRSFIGCELDEVQLELFRLKVYLDLL
jgi:hypothetical protein